ncbi:conserved hypothetical protein [Candida tropicalis MYA-3404]|uniref:Trafficking protein particle complex subunit n=1 Tax=Candida tropicalis (strain ATCC MYA-3404 / T1) TaxID=294747 RepID=C5MDQ6_CANTT|nr:conserved hypothetical protein [Candida tropicalis MYA-3404]EER32137.1 conserved hypothetical protein [Candida tropicalis MYA-3404]KAG4405735.1 hypothetical protein JTP64_004606 [Candida tropicalis]MCP8715950.1 hypothetical protein [Asgard group archaeon]
MTESTTTVEKSIDQETPINQNPIQFISLISRTDKPLYIQAFNIDDLPSSTNDSTIDKNKITTTNSNANKFLKFNFLSHMALDIFASPSSLSLREQQQQQQVQNKGDLNTVLLFIQDQVMVYGYETNNGLKIVVGLDQNYQINHKNLDKLFLDIHKCYLRTIFNPLNGIINNSPINTFDHVDEGEILLQSSTFDKNIKKLVNSFI